MSTFGRALSAAFVVGFVLAPFVLAAVAWRENR